MKTFAVKTNTAEDLAGWKQAGQSDEFSQRETIWMHAKMQLAEPDSLF